MFEEGAFDKICGAAYVYFSDDSTLVIEDFGGGHIEFRLSIERYFERMCGCFKIEIGFEDDVMTVAWGFDGTTLRVRDTITLQELESLPQVTVKMIDGILERHGHPDAPQPVEEPDIARLMKCVADRWERLSESEVVLVNAGIDGLTWLGSDEAEVLSLVPGKVCGKWQINAIAHRYETSDWTDVDVSRSVYDAIQQVVGTPRIPHLTTYTFRDHDTANPYEYWLRQMRDELWVTVELYLETYLGRDL